MLNFISDLSKSVVSAVATPIALVADVVTLPASAYASKHPFGRTKRMMGSVTANFTNAVQARSPYL